jgi:hypothetical protein
MNRRIVFAAVMILFAAVALAEAPADGSESWLQEAAAMESASGPEPVFVAGIDSGGAGNEIQPGPGCRLVELCVNDSWCHQIYPGFWACVWMENFACGSIYCESGE